ncbi:phosphoribosylanthranilate isomerase [Brunnivagina elsteri]|uniref:N-(5'-phosphoribosyl)anthranilate isomerase n=1 Tax=Brunnivagina elsteri CCALA 953 TaxID=987040 RepID=A0A2A2TFF4_9CYAN|nr:phosphoribosylanthranilate isomerase [Calothrix elsteri]PAX52421.1 phosphoribosylanthranilate isomerase [Calothrix elsteri CCALA 953]
MRIKICGIKTLEQAQAIATYGATALGFICVQNSPRYISSEQIKLIVDGLPENIDKIGVFANESVEKIVLISQISGLTGVQLHDKESPEFCQELRQELTKIEIIKALRIRNLDDLENAVIYTNYVDTLLLDAYHPQQLGGTGQTLDWNLLQNFNPGCPWFLAGGLTPNNIIDALSQLKPNGIDLSSGVEIAPGNKDLDKVARLFARLGMGDRA